ncbi:MAG: glycosyltransferase [Deltaproteobacteria bacterium]|nr:glycosyltransferase [Deltaproteobacteria bacterium]
MAAPTDAPVSTPPDGPRHVAIFIRSLYGSGGGGAERMMVNLATGLAELGHRVDLLLGRAEGPYLDEISSSVRCINLDVGGAVTAIPTLARRPDLLRGLWPLGFGAIAHWAFGAIPGLVHYLREEHPAGMITALNNSNIAAVCAREIAGVDTRLMITERNTLSEVVRQVPKLKNRVLPRLVRTYYPLADVMGAVSQGVADDLARVLDVPAETVHVTYNPVVDSDLPKRAAEPVDHPWLQGEGPPVFLGVGKFKAQKGFDLLIRAFAKVRAEIPSRLVIIGEGKQRAALEELRDELGLSDDVDLPGFANNPFAYMARASVFVLSSRFEGLPGVLIQAMASGAPVVSTDCPSGPREILRDGELGPLVPVEDVEALAAAMKTACATPVDTGRLRARADDFSVRRVAQHHLDLLLGKEAAAG